MEASVVIVLSEVVLINLTKHLAQVDKVKVNKAIDHINFVK